MARGGKIAYRCRTKKKVWVKKKGSDESDEDYMVGEEDGLDESEDEKHSFVSEDVSEESSGEFEDEEDDDDEPEEGFGKKKIKENYKPRGRKGFQGRKNSCVGKPREKHAAYSEEENQEDDNFDGSKRRKKSRLSQDVEEDGGGDIELWHGQEKPRKKTRVSSAEKYEDYVEKLNKESDVSYREEKGDDDYNDSDDNINEEFAPDDEKELLATKKNRVSRLTRQAAAQIAKEEKRKRNSKEVKRTRRRKPRTQQVIRRRRNRPDPGKEFGDHDWVPQNRARIIKHDRGRRKKSSVSSDSVFSSAGLNDQDYTISEKLEDMTIEVGKQVCGICLSEEGKRTVRGLLNCCSHYFCFSCIMEWSKVESRCPLCKQRFATISRTARIDGKFNLRNAAIPVPERDQVYQPSEEELRGFIDPYENVHCAECQQGGDDALMLLCDLCDLPVHTYCAGLGHEVPEGNWYCDGCNPTALGSSNAQAMNPTSDHGADHNLAVVSSPGATVREPLTQVTGHSAPTHSIGDFQAASPSSGSVAFTLYERQRIQRQIHQLPNYGSRHLDRSDVVAQVSGGSPFGSQIGQDGLMAPRQTVTPARIEQQNVYHQGRLPNHSNPLLDSREALSPRLSSLRGQILDNEASPSRDHSLNGLPCNEYIGINLMIGRGLSNQQFHPCSSRLPRGPGTSLSPCQSRVMIYSPREKEQVQPMVKRHIKSLSRNMEIGYRTFKDDARTSTHTILAAVGFEHRQNEVYPVHTQPLSCDHFESGHTCPIPGQCTSCFDWFVRNGRMYDCSSMASTVYQDEKPRRPRGGTRSSSRRSQDTERMQAEWEAQKTINEHIRIDLQATQTTLEATQQENVSLKDRMTSLEEQVRRLVAGLPQPQPHTSRRVLYSRGSSSRGRVLPGSSHFDDPYSAGSSLHRCSGKVLRYSPEYIPPSEDFGHDDGDGDSDDAYDDNETQSP
ncbi:uncharacterized protein [Primulina huaijiensis]|uniref:uncharacterized protein isoform X2 n=1 Tax=Primulina huaijiensis TaxID=1492673 RepID=UPI003CC70FD8